MPTSTSSPSSLPLSAAPNSTTAAAAAAAATNINTNPFASFSSFIHHHFSRFASHLFTHSDEARRRLLLPSPLQTLPYASSFSSWDPPHHVGKHVLDIALSPDSVARAMAGTAVYTVSNSSNEFVLVSDPNNGLKSLGLLCFRHEDAQALLAQVQLRQPVLGRGARVVLITLDQVYMLKVEGIAFRFLPDPIQIKNALQLKAADISQGFDGVPVFQSDLLVMKKKNKRYCPIYFQKEDIERELLKVSRRGQGSSANIMVGSLEDVLKKMEMNNKNTGWDDLIFIPPGKSYTQHIDEVAA